MRSVLSALAVAAIVATSQVHAVAADLKCNPMKLVVPFPAGGLMILRHVWSQGAWSRS